MGGWGAGVRDRFLDLQRREFIVDTGNGVPMSVYPSSEVYTSQSPPLRSGKDVRDTMRGVGPGPRGVEVLL